MNKKVEIVCKNHGSFYQLPTNHINAKQGCIKCGFEATRITQEEFIKRAKYINGNKYDYSESIYVKSNLKLKIICKKHGEFYQYPHSHISSANGCPKCTGYISKKETLWLDYLNVPIENRNKNIKINNKNYRVDAFDSLSNTVYEFYGDYWHGNPEIYNLEFKNNHNGKFFKDLYNKTIDRENIIKNSGYNIISIWENKWDSIYKTLK